MIPNNTSKSELIFSLAIVISIVVMVSLVLGTISVFTGQSFQGDQDVLDRTNFDSFANGHNIVIQHQNENPYSDEEFEVLLHTDYGTTKLNTDSSTDSHSNLLRNNVDSYEDYTTMNLDQNSPRYVIPINMMYIDFDDSLTVEVIHEPTDTVVHTDTHNIEPYEIDIVEHREGTEDETINIGFGSTQVDTVTSIRVRTQNNDELVAPLDIMYQEREIRDISDINDLETGDLLTSKTYEVTLNSDGIHNNRYTYYDDESDKILSIFIKNHSNELNSVVLTEDDIE